MASIIVDFLIDKLKEQAFQEITFQWGFDTEIVKITTRLANMKGYVEDSCKGKQDTNRAETWAKDLRKASLDLEDLVDEFMVDMEFLDLNDTTTQACNFCQLKSLTATVLSFPRKAWMKCCFHQQLKAIDERLRDLEDLKSTLDIQLKTTNEARNELLMGSGSGYMDAVEVVGIDMEVKRIAGMIVGDVQMKVITIWGAGGCGKTTLANQVYEKVKYDRSIDCCSWVDVKQNSDIVYVLRETIKGLYKNVGTKPPPELNLEKADGISLQQHLLDYLKEKRYVIFFDDVWDHNLLTQIKIPSNRGSSLIITSCEKNIDDGSFLGSKPRNFEVKPLEFDLACKLFCKLAFHNNEDDASAGGGICSWPNDTIKEAGEKLVRKCSGLPVAILAVARLMSTKGTDDLREWRDAEESLDSELVGSLKSVNRAVLLSYNKLPTHLKSCFLYCAMFPKGYSISAKELIRMCIAEGFVNEEEEHGGKTLEEIAKENIRQLRYRSLIQIVPDKNSGEEVGTIKMHDLYREVACAVIRREMFGEIILEHNINTIPAEWKKQRRLFIMDDKVKLDNYQNMTKLRTLIINGKQIGAVNSFPRQLLQSMKLLRVLVLKWIPADDMEKVPDELGDLINLRYITLHSSYKIKHLPDSLGRLHNLQTLDISGTGIKSLPESVSELKQLRHLFGNGIEVPDIVFTTFSQLQTLFGIRISTTIQATALANITQLTELNILFEEEEIWRAIRDSVQKITKLRSLSISLTGFKDRAWDFGNFSPPIYLEHLSMKYFSKLPKFTTTLNYLRSIHLIDYDGDKDSFSSLEKLPSLVLLKIGVYTGEKLLCSDGSFPKLNNLQISCIHLKKWELGKGAMKCLQSLSMVDCNYLEMLPQGLRELECLKELYLWGVPQQLIQRISVGGLDRSKVQHIPRVYTNGILMKG